LANIEQRKRLAGQVARTGEKRDARKREGNRILGRPRHRLEGTIIIYIKKKRQGVDWTHLAQDRDNWQAVARKGDETSRSIKCGNFLNAW